jgi:hypothetical protein
MLSLLLWSLLFTSPLQGAITKRRPDRRPKYRRSNQWVRERAIQLRDEHGWEWEKIADALGFSARSCWQWHYDACVTGTLHSERWVRRHWYKLSTDAQTELMQALAARPDSYYDELQHLVWQRTGECVSVSTISRMCHRAGIVRKRAATTALHRSPAAMRAHAQLRQKIHYKQIIAVDESHTSGKHDLGRRYAQVWKGEGAYVLLYPQHLGRSWTVLAAMNHTGLVKCEVQELAGSKDAKYLPKALDRKLWMAMFKRTVLPHLQPCDERQLANSVVVIDNCSLHFGSSDPDDNADMVNELHELVRSKGAILCYTPPYCPRSNPIEGHFRLMNDYLRRHAHGLTKDDPKKAIEQGMLSVSGAVADSLIQASERTVRSWLRPGLMVAA